MPALTPFWGVGPRIGLVTAAWFALALTLDQLILDALTAQRLRLRLPFPVALAIGLALLLTGITLYLITLRHLRRARRHHRLAVTGLYRHIRHPLYAIALLLLTPGFCILFRSWLILTTPLAMAAALVFFIPAEEAELERIFGDPYRAYRQKTGPILPRRP